MPAVLKIHKGTGGDIVYVHVVPRNCVRMDLHKQYFFNIYPALSADRLYLTSSGFR